MNTHEEHEEIKELDRLVECQETFISAFAKESDQQYTRIAELEAENKQLRLVIRSVLHVLDNGENITNVDVINMRDALAPKAGA